LWVFRNHPNVNHLFDPEDLVMAMLRFSSAAILALSLGMTAPPARAEVTEVSLGKQFGAQYLPMMVMENLKLVEKHLAASGMSDVQVKWNTLGGPAALVDAFLSGNLHFAAQGTPSLGLLWDRTKGGLGVKAVAAIASHNFWLNTKTPNAKSLRDFGEKDRIAMPSIKVSMQAVLLEMAVEKEWGVGQHTKLDNLVVQMPHPEALTAVLSPAHEVTSHFATSPFHEAETKAGLKTVISAYDIMGGPVTGLIFVSTEKFRADNPKIFAAVSAGFDEALLWINADKRRAAKLYLEITKDKKVTEDDMYALMTGPNLVFTKSPSKVGPMLDFMSRVGALKNKPASWKDVFFPEAQSLPGS
jgi:sulfonate transport system substrate-binding protein